MADSRVNEMSQDAVNNAILDAISSEVKNFNDLENPIFNSINAIISAYKGALAEAKIAKQPTNQKELEEKQRAEKFISNNPLTLLLDNLDNNLRDLDAPGIANDFTYACIVVLKEILQGNGQSDAIYIPGTNKPIPLDGIPNSIRSDYKHPDPDTQRPLSRRDLDYLAITIGQRNHTTTNIINALSAEHKREIKGGVWGGMVGGLAAQMLITLTGIFSFYSRYHNDKDLIWVILILQAIMLGIFLTPSPNISDAGRKIVSLGYALTTVASYAIALTVEFTSMPYLALFELGAYLLATYFLSNYAISLYENRRLPEENKQIKNLKEAINSKCPTLFKPKDPAIHDKSVAATENTPLLRTLASAAV